MKARTATLLKPTVFTLLAAVFIALPALAGLRNAAAQDRPRWKIHDLERPRPLIVTPAAQDRPVPPPSDAIVLFDGTDLAKWRDEKGEPATWRVEEGCMIPSCKGEDIYTARPFGDVQLHVEWSAPAPPKGTGQGRGNSGVFLMGLYEVQVLDSFESDTYADGQAAALYGQHPPLVNACLPPGKWQTYDIVFRRPRFSPEGRLAAPARATVFQNGVLVQDGAVFNGPTMWLQYLPYTPHPDKLPLVLQDHGNPVRYRNIWVRELRENDEPGPPPRKEKPVIFLTAVQLERYVGTYKFRPDSKSSFVITSDGEQLTLTLAKEHERVDLVPHSPESFSMRWTAARVEFSLPAEGMADAMTLHVGDGSFTVKRVE